MNEVARDDLYEEAEAMVLKSVKSELEYMDLGKGGPISDKIRDGFAMLVEILDPE